MYRNTKWANEIRKLQDAEGKWGWFHTLSRPSSGVITTEQALRRLHCLGFTMEDDCIQKAVAYMDACLRGEKEIPDRREKDARLGCVHGTDAGCLDSGVYP